MSNLKIGPLEVLTELTAVEYLSDLQTISYDLVRRQLRNINPEDYTLFQWQDTANYLTGKDIKLDSVKEIYEYLLSYGVEV